MIDDDGPFIARVTSPAPASPSAALFVTILSFDGGRAEHGPCLWEPPAGGLPVVGELCVVVRALEEDGEGEQTVVIAFDRDDSAALAGDVTAEAGTRAAADTALDARLDVVEARRRVVGGSGTITFLGASPNGQVTVNHGLGVIPTSFSVTPTGSDDVIGVVQGGTMTSSSFVVVLSHKQATNIAAGQQRSFYWLAIA